MVSPISSAIHAPVAAPPAAASRPQATPAQIPQPAINDTFQPSKAIVSIATQALQETTETNSQTVKEAGAGDIQAKNLLARETAAAKSL
jgi:hypothetical protein